MGLVQFVATNNVVTATINQNGPGYLGFMNANTLPAATTVNVNGGMLIHG
jgi:hypothetical protein